LRRWRGCTRGRKKCYHKEKKQIYGFHLLFLSILSWSNFSAICRSVGWLWDLWLDRCDCGIINDWRWMVKR
jgi:hypothetical protein